MEVILLLLYRKKTIEHLFIDTGILVTLEHHEHALRAQCVCDSHEPEDSFHERTPCSLYSVRILMPKWRAEGTGRWLLVLRWPRIGWKEPHEWSRVPQKPQK